MAWKYKGDKYQNDPMGFSFVWLLSFVSLIQKALVKKKKGENKWEEKFKVCYSFRDFFLLLVLPALWLETEFTLKTKQILY